MFLDWAAQLGLLEHQDDTNLIGEFPIAVRGVIADQTVRVLLDDGALELVKTRTHALWMLEAVGQGFTLPLSQESVIENSIELYRQWIEGVGGLGRPQPVEDDFQFFLQAMLKHASLIFIPREGPVEVHAGLCTRVLDIYTYTARNMGDQLEPETWTVLLKLILSAVDSLLRPNPHQLFFELAKALCPVLWTSLIEIWIRSGTQDEHLWGMLSNAAINWRHWKHTITSWSTTVLAMTLRVIRLLYGPTAGTDTVVLAHHNQRLQLDIEPESLFDMWYRWFFLLANPNTIENQSNFLTMIDGIARIVDAFIRVGSDRSEARKTVPEVNIPETPDGNVIMHLVGSWLFETAMNELPGYDKGRAMALGVLCSVFCFRRMKSPFQPAYLAHFYNSIRRGLMSANPGCIQAILLNSTSIFACDLNGVTMLVPYFVHVLNRLLPLQNADFTVTTGKAKLRQAAIAIVGTLISFPNHFDGLPFMVPEEDETGSKSKKNLISSYSQLRPKIDSLLLEALHCEGDSRNIKMILWSLTVNLYESCESSKELSFRTVTAVQTHLDSLDWPTDVMMTAFQALRSLVVLQENTASVNESTMSCLVQGICRFIVNQLNNAQQRMDILELTNLLETAYDCLLAWMMVDQWILIEEKCLPLVLQTIETGLRQLDNAGDTRRKKISPQERIFHAANELLFHFCNRIGNYPSCVGPGTTSSIPDEEDIMASIGEAHPQAYVSYFCYKNSVLMTVIERPHGADGPECTLILRDATGKRVWNCRMNFLPHAAPVPEDPTQPYDDPELQIPVTWTFTEFDPPDIGERYPSPEMDTLQAAISSLSARQADMEAAIISDYKATAASMDIAQNPPAIPVKHEALCKFQMSRLLLFHMGLLTLENYSNFHLLDRSAAVTRKILQLDSEPARNCMSVGVLFTRPGQTTEAEYLLNTGGSPQFNTFLETLGWDVELNAHYGYTGDLDPEITPTATYWSDHKHEVVFHVPTQVDPDAVGDVVLYRRRLLENDAVVIVWTGDNVDMLTPLTATNNVIYLYIHPLPNGLYRIRITSKNAGVPLFGPLLSGMVVSAKILGDLVRETAMNASIQVRNLEGSYSTPYLRRQRMVQDIVGMGRKRLPLNSFYSSLFAGYVYLTPQGQAPASAAIGPGGVPGSDGGSTSTA